MRDLDIMTEDEADQWQTECDECEDEEDDSWREWRVRFEDADALSTILCFEGEFTPKVYNDEFVATYTDAAGVFQLRSAYRAYAEAALPS